jgi:hypothetical protein
MPTKREGPTEEQVADFWDTLQVNSTGQASMVLPGPLHWPCDQAGKPYGFQIENVTDQPLTVTVKPGEDVVLQPGEVRDFLRPETKKALH